MSEVKQRIRAARAFAGRNQSGVAVVLDMHVDTYKKIESGEREPLRKELLAIAEATGVPIEFLDHGFDGATWPAKDRERPPRLADKDRPRPPIGEEGRNRGQATA